MGDNPFITEHHAHLSISVSLSLSVRPSVRLYVRTYAQSVVYLIQIPAPEDFFKYINIGHATQ